MSKIINYIKKAYVDFIYYFSKNIRKTSITLEMNDKGGYIVKAYGIYITSTLTSDKAEAEKNFQDIVNHAKGKDKFNHIIIKEAIYTY